MTRSSCVVTQPGAGSAAWTAACAFSAAERAENAPRYGAMFWLSLKKFVGS
jgi:hypothetical protein